MVSKGRASFKTQGAPGTRGTQGMQGAQGHRLRPAFFFKLLKVVIAPKRRKNLEFVTLKKTIYNFNSANR